MNRTSLRRSVVAPLSVLVVALLHAAPARAQQPEQPPGIKLGAGDVSLTIRGILSATVFLQDGIFGLGNGQQAEFVTQELEGWWHGGDVRNTRLSFDFRGPEVRAGWRANATLEADFFGGFPAGAPPANPGAGAFGDEQPVPRIRLAYADLTNGRTTLRIGQGWALTLGNIPVSTSHIGFPLGWGSGGFLGWRFPGIFFTHSFTPAPATPVAGRTTPGPVGPRAQIQLAVMKGSWSDETAADQPSAGEAGTPQFEARLDLDGRTGAGTWGAYVVGHWDRKDLNGVRAKGAPEPAENNLDSWAVEGGARVQSGALTLHGNAYTGKAMGHHFGQIIQFGDIKGWGAWVQGGLNLGTAWSAWLYYGTENPDDERLTAANARLNSWLLVPMLRYKVGPYSLGLEWLYSYVDARTAVGTPPVLGSVDRKGNQFSLSVRYDF